MSKIPTTDVGLPVVASNPVRNAGAAQRWRARFSKALSRVHDFSLPMLVASIVVMLMLPGMAQAQALQERYSFEENGINRDPCGTGVA